MNRNVDATTAQYCYDATNTQTLATRTAAGETNGPTTSTVSGGVVTCSATTNANCGIVLASGMGVCITASSPTASVLYLGADQSANTLSGLTNAITKCYVGTTTAAVSTSCGSSTSSPYVATAACFVRFSLKMDHIITKIELFRSK